MLMQVPATLSLAAGAQFTRNSAAGHCSWSLLQRFEAMSAIANAATYDKWFKVADQDMDGRVTGPDAVV
jgi:hypothetical protein